jgi:hypothetical protein
MTERPDDSPVTNPDDDREGGRHRRNRGTIAYVGVMRFNRVTSRLVLGLVFLSLGARWTMDNLGLLDASAIIRWWPVLLIAYSLPKYQGWGTSRSTPGALMFLLAGVWLTLHAAGYVRVGFAGLWPLLLIVFGVQLILRAQRGPQPGREWGKSKWRIDEQGRVKLDVVLSGATKRSETGPFRGGELNVVMGGLEFDLREATLPDGRADLEANAVLSSIELFVPRSWRVVSKATSVMGTIEDHTSPSGADDATRATLVLRGAAVMGAITIRN